MAKNDRVRRDAAGVGPDPDYSRRLYPIDELKDFRIASGEPDVRGWPVRTLSGREVGEVDDLLIDPERGEVVMLEVDLDRSGRHVEVELRAVQLDRERKCIVVDSADVSPEHATDSRRSARMSDEERGALAEDVRDVRERDIRYVDDARRTDPAPQAGSVPVTDADRRVAAADTPAPAERTTAADAASEEVIERRPVGDGVVEEVVVRRRAAGDDPAPGAG